MIEPAVRQRQVRDYAAILETDLATLFKAMRADVMNALKQDDPLVALEKIFGDLGADEPDDTPDADRLDILKAIEQDVSRLVEKAKTRLGKNGTLVLGDDGHWRLQDKQASGEKAGRPDFRVKTDIQLTKGFSIKADTPMTGVKVMASGNKIREVDSLVQAHKFENDSLTNPQDWEKVRGTALITDGKTTFKAEIHWYQCKNIGKVKFKWKERHDE